MVDETRLVSKLHSRLNAHTVERETKNNRVHYHVSFEQSIGLDWLHSQIEKVGHSLDTPLEIWEFHPSAGGEFVCEIREVNRRAEVPDNSDQRTLGDAP